MYTYGRPQHIYRLEPENCNNNKKSVLQVAQIQICSQYLSDKCDERISIEKDAKQVDYKEGQGRSFAKFITDPFNNFHNLLLLSPGTRTY